MHKYFLTKEDFKIYFKVYYYYFKVYQLEH